MSYQVPKCECGERLIHWQESMYEIYTPITSKGILATKGIKKVDTNVLGAYERLQCPKCLNEYEIGYDDNGRVLRSNIYPYQ